MKKLLLGLFAGIVMTLLAGQVYRVGMDWHRRPLPSTQALHLSLKPDYVDLTWIKAGTPRFSVAQYAQSPDRRSSSGLWRCDGPATFEWQFGADETVYVLDGRVEIDYQGQHFVLEKGDSAVFHADTRAVWHVPHHLYKSYTLHHPDWAVRLTRRVLTAVRPG